MEETLASRARRSRVRQARFCAGRSSAAGTRDGNWRARISPENEKEFDRAYSEIAQLLRHEYSIAFSPPAKDGQVHTIQVKVSAWNAAWIIARRISRRLPKIRSF